MEDDWPLWLGTGSASPLNDGDDKHHRFWSLRSPSKAAAIADSRPQKRPIGFHRPKQ